MASTEEAAEEAPLHPDATGGHATPSFSASVSGSLAAPGSSAAAYENGSATAAEAGMAGATREVSCGVTREESGAAHRAVSRGGRSRRRCQCHRLNACWLRLLRD